MTELEQHLIASLEKLESGLREELTVTASAMEDLESRVATLEQHAPVLVQLCKELENTLQRLNATVPAR